MVNPLFVRRVSADEKVNIKDIGNPTADHQIIQSFHQLSHKDGMISSCSSPHRMGLVN